MRSKSDDSFLLHAYPDDCASHDKNPWCSASGKQNENREVFRLNHPHVFIHDTFQENTSDHVLLNLLS